MNDTEMNVVTNDRELVTATRERLGGEHLELFRDDIRDRTPSDLFDERRLRGHAADAPLSSRRAVTDAVLRAERSVRRRLSCK
jgi:hypothetical protein